MRRMTQWVITLLAGLFVFGGLGCGMGGGNNDKKIVIWEQRDPQERRVMEWAIKSFEEAHDVEITLVHYDTENLRTQFQTAALGGGGPDLVYGPSDQIGPFSVLSIILPLDDFMPAEFWDKFEPGALDRLGGKVWAAPDQVGNHLALLYNKALLPEPPTTFDELIRMAKANTIDEEGDGRFEQYGIALQLEEPFWLVPFITAYGGWVMDEEFNPDLDNPSTVQALQFLKDLKDTHEVTPKESTYELMDTLFKQGNVAMIVNGAWSFREYIDYGIDLGIARIPRVKPGGKWASPMVGSKGYSVNVNVPASKAPIIKELLEHLTSVIVTSRFATELGILPSVTTAYSNPLVKDDPVLIASKSQFDVGTRMPVVPEMRIIWDSMRPNMQLVMNGSKSPTQAARNMQGEAMQKIKASRR